MQNKILRVRQVIAATGLSRTTIWRLGQRRDGSFPKPVRLGPNAIGWREDDVREWIDSRPDASA